MRTNLRIVSRMPLQELWDTEGLIAATRVRDVSSADIRGLLQLSHVRFVVADIGYQLEWIPVQECFQFWKTDVKEHVADANSGSQLEGFPQNYFYFASEWRSAKDDLPILLLERHH